MQQTLFNKTFAGCDMEKLNDPEWMAEYNSPRKSTLREFAFACRHRKPFYNAFLNVGLDLKAERSDHMYDALSYSMHMPGLPKKKVTITQAILGALGSFFKRLF